MKFFLTLVAAYSLLNGTPLLAEEPAPITINDCLTILSGLNSLDGRMVVVNAGKPSEQVINQAYEFNNGALRGDIADNIAALTIVQRTAQEAQGKITLDIAKGDPEIKPGTPKALEYDRQLRELVARPCGIPLKRVKTSDLKLDRNEIPASVLAAIDKIRDK